MYLLQLFGDDETQPRDARLLREGSLSLGRDPGADWPIADPSRTLSRIHCRFEVDPGGALRTVALGANGVTDEASGARLPAKDPVPVATPASLRLGEFRLRITEAADVEPLCGLDRTLIASAGMPETFDVPSEWQDPAAPSLARDPDATPGSLLEAFCEGAGLDASQLAREDPADILRRIGGIYRQMVLGVGDLMSERDRAREHHILARTTIGGSNNNPFKWAPSQRLAIDLISGECQGYLSGPDALQASFRDIKRHIAATGAGFRASLREAVESLTPDRLAKSAKPRSIVQSRAAATVDELSRQSADLLAQVDGASSGSLDEAFTHAYLAVDTETGTDPR